MNQKVPTQVETKLLRRLEDGWSYRPDWRARQIEQHLVNLAVTEGGRAELDGLTFFEPDPYVRQALRYRYNGKCVHQQAIAQAFQLARENATTGVASRIKALVVADQFAEEIAELLHLSVSAVVTYEKLFWDVRRYLGVNLWLDSLVRSAENAKSAGPEATREAVWLRAALDGGWIGLERLWFRKSGTDAKSLDELAREIEAIAARRSLRHLQQLEESGEPVGDDDLKRLAVVSRRTTAPAPDAGKADYTAFFAALLGEGTRNLLKEAPGSSKALAIMAAGQDRKMSCSSAPTRRRMRALQGS